MRELLNLLKKLQSDRTKTLVFSQMTRMLDICEVVLADADIKFLRLDGSTPINERQVKLMRIVFVFFSFLNSQIIDYD